MSYRMLVEKGRDYTEEEEHMLLCDINSAKAAMPDIRLPQRRFAHPEDAERQIRMGMDYFERLSGYRPPGCGLQRVRLVKGL